MSDNEEPVTATEQDGTDQIIDLDDVEGHGLREVAAGLGAAAVLAGGGTAAAATIGVHPSSPDAPRVPSIGSVVDATDRLADGGVNTVRGERDAALSAAGTTAAGATSTSARVAGGAVQTADAMAEAAGNIAQTEVQFAERVAGGAVEATGNVASATVRYAGSQASGAGSTATSTAGGAQGTATTTAGDTVRKAATVTRLAVQEAGALVTSIHINVSEVTPSAGAGVSAQQLGGFVSVDLGGGTIMRVELQDGQATIDLNTRDLVGKVLGVTYSGDSMHASSARTLSF